MKSFSNSLLLFISLLFFFGCRKDLEYVSSKTGFENLRKPVLESFTVNSLSYKNDGGQSNLDARKKADTNPFDDSNPFGPISSAYKDSIGKIVPTRDPKILNKFNLYFHQRYKSQMFTISDQSMALNIYPGAILDGRSVDGMFDPRMLQGVSDRIRPITISTSMPVSGSAVASTSLPRPTAERSMLNSALTDLEELNPGGVGAASLQVEIDSFTVYEELKTLYGYNKGIDVFLYNKNTEKQGENHLITSKSAIKLKFFQQNFTIDTDLPNGTEELFDPTGLNLDTLSGGVIPVYVKSVTYGRMGVMVIESGYSSDKLYNAVYKQLGILKNLVGIDKNLTEEEKAILNSADIRMKYTGIGQDSDNTIKVNGITGFVDILSANKTYSKQSPGIPVAFQLAHLDDHSIVEAPFQINYGPYDKPYVGITYGGGRTKKSNSNDQFNANIEVNFADIYFNVFTDETGLKLSTVPPPNFLVFEYSVTDHTTVHDRARFKSMKTTGPSSIRKITRLPQTKYIIGKDVGVNFHYEAEGVFDQMVPYNFEFATDGLWPKYQYVILDQRTKYEIVPSDYYNILAP